METCEEQTFLGLEIELTSCPQAFRVNQLPLPGSEEAKKMTAGSGAQSAMLLNQSDPLGQFSKILLESSHWTNSKEYVYAWSRLDTAFELSAFRLTQLEQNISDTECSLWRSPNQSDATGGGMDGERRLEQGHQLNLQEQAVTPKLWPNHSTTGSAITTQSAITQTDALCQSLISEEEHAGSEIIQTNVLKNRQKLWPTPHAADGTGGGSPIRHDPNATGGRSNLRDVVKGLIPTAGDAKASGSRNTESSNAHSGTSLTDWVRMDGGEGRLWPTPRESEWKGTGPLGSKSQQHRADRFYLDAIAQERCQLTGSLNPEFVTWLMGFPLGWTELLCPDLSVPEKTKSKTDPRDLKLLETA
jgi:hypothetical protein